MGHSGWRPRRRVPREVLGVELDQRQEGIGPIGLLGRQEGVEAPDDVRCYRLHRPGAVEHEVDVHGRAVSFMAVSLVLSWDSSSPRNPRSSTKRMVSLIARPSSLPHFGETPHQFVGEPGTDEVAGAGTRCP